MTELNSTPRVALVLSDIDGTLLDNNKNLTPGAPAAVQRLYHAGIRFTLASARPPRLTRELVRELHVTRAHCVFQRRTVCWPR